MRGKSDVTAVRQQKKQVAKQSWMLWIQMLLCFFPFSTFSKNTPLKPLVKEQMTMQMKPNRGCCSVVTVFAVDVLLLSSTRPTPGTMITRASHWRSERRRFSRKAENRAVVKIFIWYVTE